MSISNAGPQPADHQLVISRLIDAPRNKVFRAWTEPKVLAQWWGPHGMTTPECEMDLWVGGQFRTLMRAPDGSEYPTSGVFLEIQAPRRLVFLVSEKRPPPCAADLLAQEQSARALEELGQQPNRRDRPSRSSSG